IFESDAPPRSLEVGTVAATARRLFIRSLENIARGQLTLRHGDQTWTFGADDGTGLHASMDIYDASAYMDIVLGGTIGSAESYMKGRWSSPDLTAVIRVFTRNEAAITDL